MELFLNALVSGLLLGGFYAAVTLGLTIAFGQLDIVNIAHPAFVIVGSYVTYMLNTEIGIDPVLMASSSPPCSSWSAPSSTASTTPASSAPVKKR